MVLMKASDSHYCCEVPEPETENPDLAETLPIPQPEDLCYNKFWHVCAAIKFNKIYACMQEDEDLGNESNGSDITDEEEDDSSSGNDNDDDDDDDGDEKSEIDTFSKVFEALKPEVVSNLLQACRSHELFPLFEDHEVGSSEHQPNKCAFGDSPKEDLDRWNSWLDNHGDTWFACKVPLTYGPADWS